MNIRGFFEFFPKTKDALVAPIIRRIPSYITPNQLTSIRFVILPFICYLLLIDQFTWALALTLIGFFTDALDGALARTRNQISRVGVGLDPLADKLLFAVAFIGLTWGSLPTLLFQLVLALEIAQVIMALFFVSYTKKKSIALSVPAQAVGKVKLGVQISALAFSITSLNWLTSTLFVIAVVLNAWNIFSQLFRFAREGDNIANIPQAPQV